MIIERKILNREEKSEVNDYIPLSLLKTYLEPSALESEHKIKLETYGSIIKLTISYKYFEEKYDDIFLISDIDNEKDVESLAKALRIIYERIADEIVKGVSKTYDSWNYSVN